MPQYDDTNRGVLFKNDRKEKANQPDYRGKLNVGGREYQLSAWRKTPKGGGNPFLSISISDPPEQGSQVSSKGDNGFFDD